MRKIVQLLFPFILCVMQFSCNRDRNSELLNLDLSQIDNHSEIAISNVVQDLRYISLATKENCLIANKFKIYVVEDFIITIARNQILYLISNLGNFCVLLQDKGKGQMSICVCRLYCPSRKIYIQYLPIQIMV